MSGLRLGSLCSGYGGLELGVQAAIGGTTAWVSDVDKGACKILAHRFPGVPNIGDMTAVDWTQVEPVDVLTGGTPCQDLSHAGKRAGMTEGTRSNLWVAMREAIATLQPRLVVWENVSGAYSAEADSDLGSDPRLLDGTRRRAGEPVLRALGRVLGDLASLGYVGGWHGLRAADVGAPHGRLRVFVVAYPGGVGGREGGGLADRLVPDRDRTPAVPVERGGGALLPSPRATDGTKGGPNQRGSSGDLMLPSAVTHLLPTPAVNDMGASYTPDEWDAAIHRWEHHTRPAPPPTENGPKGNPRLSAAFSEWMMGLPAGWVTDVPGITRNEALKALGNGVVPQQAEAAVRFLLAVAERAA